MSVLILELVSNVSKLLLFYLTIYKKDLIIRSFPIRLRFLNVPAPLSSFGRRTHEPLTNKLSGENHEPEHSLVPKWYRTQRVVHGCPAWTYLSLRLKYFLRSFAASGCELIPSGIGSSFPNRIIVRRGRW